MRSQFISFSVGYLYRKPEIRLVKSNMKGARMVRQNQGEGKSRGLIAGTHD